MRWCKSANPVWPREARPPQDQQITDLAGLNVGFAVLQAQQLPAPGYSRSIQFSRRPGPYVERKLSAACRALLGRTCARP